MPDDKPLMTLAYAYGINVIVFHLGLGLVCCYHARPAAPREIQDQDHTSQQANQMPHKMLEWRL